MKKLHQKRAKRLMFMAIGLMAFIFGIMALVSPEHALGSTMAIAIVVGGVNYGEGEEGIAKALDGIATNFQNKMANVTDKTELDKLKQSFADQLKELKLGISKDEFDEALKNAKTELEGKLKAQWEEVVKLTAKDPVDAHNKSFAQVIEQAFIDNGFVEKYTTEFGEEKYRFKNIRDKKLNASVDVVYNLKNAVDMNTALSVRPGSTPGMNIGSLTDYGMTPQLLPMSMDQHFLGSFISGTTTEKYYGVVKEVTETDGSGVRAEDAAAGQSSFMWDTDEYKVFDFAAAFRVHQNTLDDLSNVSNRIATIGRDRILSQIDAATLASNGNGTTIPLGIATATYYTAYDTTLRQGLVQSANIIDVIKNAKLQLRKAKHPAQYVMLNSSDVATIESMKDANDNTVALAGVRLDATGQLAYIYGLSVIINDNVTANTFFMLAQDSLDYGIRSDIGIRVGYDKDADFSKKIVTIQPECRVAIGLGSAAGIVYCSDIVSAASSLNLS